MTKAPGDVSVKVTKQSRNIDKCIANLIIRAHSEGMDIKTIVSTFTVSKATVFRMLRKNKLTGSPLQDSYSHCGRKRKTTPEMDDFILKSVEENRKLLPSQIRPLLEEKFGVTLSLTQIKARLREAGYYGRVCLKKPLLSPLNKFKRLVWAVKHKDWTIEEWKKVMWSDEKKFELFNTKRRTYCRKKINEPLRPDTVQGTVKHGGGNIMVWGCMGNGATGNLYRIEGIMDKFVYHSILLEQALPSGDKLFGNEKWVFQQDNDPKHSSKLCRSFVEEQSLKRNFSVMDWPPQSPDLSPIELLWEEVDRQVQAKKSTNVTDLEVAVKEVWRNMPTTTITKLLERMPLLCQAVIDAKGGYFQENLSHQKKN
jgi:transposase